MNKKALLAVVTFVIGLGVSVTFQNCGGSSLQANNSENGDGFNVEVLDDKNGEGDGGTTVGENGEFSFNLNQGDNIFYTNGGGLSLNLSTVRYLRKVHYALLESHIYEQRGTTFPRDLPTAYCANSALPHCAHTTTAPCVGLGCFKSDVPVRCHWQKRTSTADGNRIKAALEAINFVNRVVTPNEPMIADCNNPLLYFYSVGKTLDLSLADKACVPDGMYYALDSSGDDVQTIFDTELTDIAALTNNQGDPEYCNKYSAYAWDTSKATYSSRSGFTTPENAYQYDVEFEARVIQVDDKDVLAGMANLVFREPQSRGGDGNTYCADNVPVQPQEIDAIFPGTEMDSNEDGLIYEVMRTQAVIADASTAEITYEDPVDGGSVWRLFLDRGTALTHSGGAILDADQGDAIRNVMETVLVNRAKTSGLAQPCPPAN